jgi:uncharacterized protein with GYD domain
VWGELLFGLGIGSRASRDEPFQLFLRNLEVRYDLHHLKSFFPGGICRPQRLQAISYECLKANQSQCPGVVWKDSFATLGPFDVVVVVEAEDPKQVEKAAMLIRAFGHSTTETLTATPWQEFLGAL